MLRVLCVSVLALTCCGRTGVLLLPDLDDQRSSVRVLLVRTVAGSPRRKGPSRPAAVVLGRIDVDGGGMGGKEKGGL